MIFIKRQKYSWTFVEIDDWYKKEAEKLSERLGMKISPAVIQKLIHENIILPSKINALDLVKIPEKRINKNKIKRFLF